MWPYQALHDASLAEVLVVVGEPQVEWHHQAREPARADQEHAERETEHQEILSWG